jgi:hypothetical protein
LQCVILYIIGMNAISSKDNLMVDIYNENMILREQVMFLTDCITNQMNNLEALCESSKTNVIHKEDLKPFYEKTYKCEIYI